MIEVDGRVIAVIGLGYVGLPIAVEFGKRRQVIGFDVNEERIAELEGAYDRTSEVSAVELAEAKNLRYTTKAGDLRSASIYIVTVPTPIDQHKRPDLGPLKYASEIISNVLGAGDIVIYESTVFPGATEEICVPILETGSGLHFNVDFFCGYSPERINPGDKSRHLTTIKKVTSGSTPEVADVVDALYASIITAGTWKAESMRVAEAAKVIENTQRDINIALVNELSIIFSRMDLDTEAVLNAAGTKWNFLPFRPGLVGGHCIGVDPYYLTYKAEILGYHPQVILAGRRINDGMGAFVAARVIKAMLKRKIQIDGAKVLIMGFTFKENCPDLRNTRVIDVVRELSEFGILVDIYDPWADPVEALQEYGVYMTAKLGRDIYDALIVTVAHNEFLEMGAAHIRSFGRDTHVLFDLKYLFGPDESDLRI